MVSGYGSGLEVGNISNVEVGMNAMFGEQGEVCGERYKGLGEGTWSWVLA